MRLVLVVALAVIDVGSVDLAASIASVSNAGR